MPSATATTPLALVVKNETASLHQEVEKILLPKLQAIRSFEDYAIILKMFYGFFHPLEEKIQAFIADDLLPDIKQRRTSSYIVKDIIHLGFDTSIPLCQNLPPINSTAQAFGALYVLEGSTLGGKMIAKMLAKADGPEIPPEALQFFSGYQNLTGKMWTIFVEVLNKQPNEAVVAQTANETFYQLRNWMEQCFSNEAEN